MRPRFNSDALGAKDELRWRRGLDNIREDGFEQALRQIDPGLVEGIIGSGACGAKVEAADFASPERGAPVDVLEQ